MSKCFRRVQLVRVAAVNALADRCPLVELLLRVGAEAVAELDVRGRPSFEVDAREELDAVVREAKLLLVRLPLPQVRRRRGDKDRIRHAELVARAEDLALVQVCDQLDVHDAVARAEVREAIEVLKHKDLITRTEGKMFVQDADCFVVVNVLDDDEVLKSLHWPIAPELLVRIMFWRPKGANLQPAFDKYGEVPLEDLLCRMLAWQLRCEMGDLTTGSGLFESQFQ